MTIQAKYISGVGGLPVGLQADLDLDNARLPADDVNLKTVNVSIRQLLRALGAVTIGGGGSDVAGAGLLDATIALVIQPGRVTLAKLANAPSHTLMGNTSGASATPQWLTIGAGLDDTGGILRASAPAAAQPASMQLLYDTFDGF